MNESKTIFYLIRDSEDEGKIIASITKETKCYLFGELIYSSKKHIKNKNFRIAKDLVSKYIDEYEFTKTLDLNKINK